MRDPELGTATADDQSVFAELETEHSARRFKRWPISAPVEMTAFGFAASPR